MAVIPNATMNSTRGNGTAAYTGRRVQFNFLDPTTAPVLPSGAPVTAVLFDTPDAATGYLRDDVVDIVGEGPVAGPLIQPDPHKFRVASRDPISSRQGVKGVRVLLTGIGR